MPPCLCAACKADSDKAEREGKPLPDVAPATAEIKIPLCERHVLRVAARWGDLGAEVIRINRSVSTIH